MRTLPARLALLSLLALAARAQDTVGLNAHIPADDELDAAAAIGVRWIRIDNNWITVEPEPGRFRFEELDRVVNGARQRGLEVYMTLAYAPAWAAEPDGDGVPTNNVPLAGTYERYVRANVEHFRGRVTHYGLWNEPNLDNFFEGSVQQYLERIARPGAAAVRATCPECRVLGPDLAGLSGWQGYLEAVLRGGPDLFDILTHHTYAAVPGTRAGLWACDDFEHALDIGADAICFYKPGLRQVLDPLGWQREVWITETGYRTRPWDSAPEQERQRASVEGILRSQLAKPWWTATFFYELADCGVPIPDCDIDGYGLLRRTAGPDGTPADNFFWKPAATWLRDELAQNPAWGNENPDPPPPPPPPPAARIDAPHRPEGLPDGALDDWDDAGCVLLARYEELAGRPESAADLTARACAAWSDGGLWLAVEVADDRHVNDFPDETLWQGDSVQLALDAAGDARAGQGYDANDAEWTLARARGESRLRQEHGDLSALGRVTVADGRTRYELRVPLPDLVPGRVLRASFLVNENDGVGREGWLEWTPGIGREKNPIEFGILALAAAEAVPDPDAGVSEDAGQGPPPPRADAAVVPGRDLGPAPDRGVVLDGTVLPALDGGVDADLTAQRPGPGQPVGGAGDDEGCQQGGSGSGSGAWPLALLLLSSTTWRRRARRAPHARGSRRDTAR